jgi:hypothetical protein
MPQRFMSSPPGRFQIFEAPYTEFDYEDRKNHSRSATILLDTQTGRSWHVQGKPSGHIIWRGNEFANTPAQPAPR